MELLNQKWKTSESHQQEDNQAKSGMENLPRNILLEVPSRLPPRSLMQSKSVCQAWRSLTHHPRLPYMHHLHATKSNPYLIFHCHSRVQNQLYFVGNDALQGYSKAVTKIKTPFASAKPESDIVGSCNGLLRLSDSLYTTILYICNPFTGSNIKLLKPTGFMIKEVVLGFGFHPITKEYKVVRIMYYTIPSPGLDGNVEYMKSWVQIFTLGTNAWRSEGKADYQLRGRSEASVNGALHWVSHSIIVSFNLVEEKFQEVPLPDCGSLDEGNYHMVVLGGCLYAVVYHSNGEIEIWVMKDYGVKESWINQFTIRTYVPSGLNPNVGILDSLWKNILKSWSVRVLCLLNNGEILLEYEGQALVSYNSKLEEFKDFTIQGLPNWFETIVHVGSLISVHVAIGMQR